MTTIKLPVQHLDAQLSAPEADGAGRLVPLTWYTGATVLQFSWADGLHNLKLSMEPKAVRLEQLNSGAAPFTKGHASPNDPDATLGVIEKDSVQLDGEKGRAVVRFSKHHPDANRIYGDVADGILRNVSLGARLHRLKEITQKGDNLKTFMALDWEPYAVALVGVGADPGAHFTAANKVELTECEVEFSAVEVSNLQGLNMQDTEQIKLLGTKHGLAELAETHILSGGTLADFQAAALAAIAAREEQTPTRSHTASITRDQRDGMAEAMAESLACRYTGKAPSDRARQYVGARIADLARECCQAAGVRVSGYAPEHTIKLAMTTGDFPELLTGTGRRVLLDAYQASQPAIKLVARRSEAQDFRTKALLRLGEAPALELVPEGGEIKHGPRAESKESYRIYEFAKIYSLTRQAIVNDDLGAFADYMKAYGVASSQLEGTQLTALLTTAAGLGPVMGDGKNLFDETYHTKYLATGTVITVDNLGIARQTLRTQTGLDGVTVVDVTPKFLVVPAGIETVAEQYLAQLAAAEPADVNPFSGKLTLVCVPELDASDDDAWYLFGSPGLAPVLEYSWLSGIAGPQIDTRQGWETLGQEFRCVMSWGCGAIGHRGVYKNAGA